MNPGLIIAMEVINKSFRYWFARNAQPICFLIAYFVLIVLGNLIFASPIGRQAIAISGYPLTILSLAHIFSVGYWVLLLMPFVVTPPIVYLVRRFGASILSKASGAFPEFSPLGFSICLLVAAAYILYQFNIHGVADLFLSGKDSVSSVEARFEIRSRLPFATFIVLQAIVPYLAYVAVINLIRSRGVFWVFASIISVIAASVFFVMINMKWPIVLFYAGVVVSIFMHTTRFAYLKTIVGAVCVVAIYLVVSTVVFRIAPPPPAVAVVTAQPSVVKEASKAQAEVSPPMVEVPKPIANQSQIGGEQVVEAAYSAAPILLMHVISRMSMPYPYYYQEFTDHPAACGGVLEQARPGPKCRPSFLIYNRMFSANDDKFLGLGTAPAAVHISGYAVGGWPLAVLGLICASLILGAFASLPLGANSTVSAFGIMGALAGYHFSQIPGEGVIFYEHGLAWTLLFIGIYAAASWAYSRFNRGRVIRSTASGT
jgi:hypothetical protein